jgi:hypothetical protein
MNLRSGLLTDRLARCLERSESYPADPLDRLTLLAAKIRQGDTDRRSPNNLMADQIELCVIDLEEAAGRDALTVEGVG